MHFRGGRLSRRFFSLSRRQEGTFFVASASMASKGLENRRVTTRLFRPPALAGIPARTRATVIFPATDRMGNPRPFENLHRRAWTRPRSEKGGHWISLFKEFFNQYDDNDYEHQNDDESPHHQKIHEHLAKTAVSFGLFLGSALRSRFDRRVHIPS